ncbi:hypothetical protein CVT25_013481 [Psilocybe cyanescens]|uniref:Transcription factor CBF/NF-Y/archaeal histone domain-containing protein n=1 Tax=Psilocybe cyanescens TaxID=93625 RepID=A0A409WTL1_PSICY|nr:hypothetical protein CVT25_013481 [Psilocybe cyanescens]
MADLHPIIPRDENSQSSLALAAQDTPEPVPITEQEVGEYREQDRFLPYSSFPSPPLPHPIFPQPTRPQIANVSRIMKSSVPPTAKIAKDAKECVQECVSEFISFITSEAAEKCQLEKRKTIGGEDILYAMGSLGFENYAETLKIHLAKLRQVGGEDILYAMGSLGFENYAETLKIHLAKLRQNGAANATAATIAREHPIEPRVDGE